MTTLSPADAVLFDPLDEAAMRAALDEALTRPAHAPWPRQESAFVAVVLAALAPG